MDEKCWSGKRIGEGECYVRSRGEVEVEQKEVGEVLRRVK